MADEISLIVGLGNPGQQYQDTRHNAGFWFAEKLCQQQNTSFNLETKFQALVSDFNFQNRIIRVLKPMTYMNLSGQAVQKLAHFYKISPQSILVVYDEIDLPPGCVRFKFEGGHAGHNGIRDIIAKLGTKAFYRIRIGVGRPKHQEEVHGYVLNRPTRGEQDVINLGIEQALTVLPDILAGNLEKAMTQLHTISK
ncbi:aminoacyl-tRNA hydrolase [Candidatus Berkiella cookevillensis]|uniref:Peptidyl-tRNA hydrolase n=1 Tax=Candidatus Berkiella cookevillensis TaxID=437022 RepID=A0A0Q9YC51_9GAMM|nr:aminoacyl-tRNA hydrolase [Candidatus Berkiella cookevillensis]MCS5709270.1 aminoacyl-tRNA hydrolase [Candidatus Berkiella cookevillensis]